MFSALRHQPRISAVLAALVVAFLVPITGIAGAQQPTCFGRVATVVASAGQVTYGTPGPDVIIGTNGNDRIVGRGGADLICARGGADAVYGGGGRDSIDLGSGDDVARGGRGADTIDGADGRDDIKGRRGNDTIRGGAGTDVCRGGKGNDSLSSCNERVAALSAAERRMVDLVQDLRARHGAGDLVVSVDMSDVARDWSTRLPDGFYHNPVVGSEIPDGWRALGENIAYHGSVEAAFDALVDSPGHFRNMVNSGFTHIGVGVHTENGRVYVTQVFAHY